MKRIAILLLLAASACSTERLTGPEAQAAVATHQSRASSLTEVVYYLDGRDISAKEVEKLDPATIESVEVLKGDAARKFAGPNGPSAIILITRKAAR